MTAVPGGACQSRESPAALAGNCQGPSDEMFFLSAYYWRGLVVDPGFRDWTVSSEGREEKKASCLGVEFCLLSPRASCCLLLGGRASHYVSLGSSGWETGLQSAGRVKYLICLHKLADSSELRLVKVSVEQDGSGAARMARLCKNGPSSME